MSVSVGGQCLRDLRDPLKRPQFASHLQRASRETPLHFYMAKGGQCCDAIALLIQRKLEKARRLNYTAIRRVRGGSMVLQLLGLAGATALILLANGAEKSRTGAPLADRLTARFAPLWRLVGSLISGLSPGSRSAFDPRKPVHRVAALLMILQVLLIILSLAIHGPAAGQDLLPSETAGAFISLFSLAGLNLALALLGVGWLTRRDSAAVRRRLGLRLPTRMDWLTGLVMAAALFVFANIATRIWAGAVSPQVFELQTGAARHIFKSFSNSLFLGLLFALVAAVSEEALYRGALQPVFGIALTSLFFTLIHAQYAFTPAALIVFVLSLGFAGLRARYSAASAIIAHASYNGLPFLLLALNGA